MCATLAGIKEAFLKVAQGVITLHQHNQLGRGLGFSPVNSYTQYTVSRQYVNDPTNNDPPSDTIHVHSPTSDSANSSIFSKCCAL